VESYIIRYWIEENGHWFLREKAYKSTKKYHHKKIERKLRGELKNKKIKIVSIIYN
jgi:hypothetical protein